MKRIIVAVMLVAALMFQAQAQKRVSDPKNHVIKPSAGRMAQSPYQGCRNYGKSIAVFGGSLSVNKESDVAKQYWADMLNAKVTTYGVPGAGFAESRGYSLQKQVDTAGVYDVYVLWASTNDFNGGIECGSWMDYSAQDGYDESKRNTQCGGINYCIRKLREKNPAAEIYFFTSLRFFRRESGYNPFSVDVNEMGESFYDFVQAQIECCKYHGIPVLDQFSLQGVDEFNYQRFYLDDKLHMNEAGYKKIAPLQVAFLANGF